MKKTFIEYLKEAEAVKPNAPVPPSNNPQQPTNKEAELKKEVTDDDGKLYKDSKVVSKTTDGTAIAGTVVNDDGNNVTIRSDDGQITRGKKSDTSVQEMDPREIQRIQQLAGIKQ